MSSATPIGGARTASKHAWTRWPIARYGVAVVTVLAAFGLRQALVAQVGESLPTYITFYPAVVVAALLAGQGPGLLATALSVAVVDYWVVWPKQLFLRGEPAEAVGVILFTVMGVFLSVLTERYRRTREQAAAYEKELIVRESQEELRRQREWLRVTLSSIGEAVLATDGAGKVTLLNPTAESLTGWKEEEALGQPAASVLRLVNEEGRQKTEDGTETQIHPSTETPAAEGGTETEIDRSTETAAIVARVLRDASASARVDSLNLITRDGREIAVELTAAPISGSAQSAAGVVVAFQDVTGKRKAQKIVLEERDFVSTVLNTTGALVVVQDLEGRIQRFNPACEQLSGYRFEEVQGRRVWEVLLSPEEAGSAHAVFEQVRAGQSPTHSENDWITKTGDRRRIAWSNTCILGAGQKAESIVATGIDLTRVQSAEAAFRKAAEQHQLALDAGELGTWSYDLVNGEVFWDERCRNLFGIKKGDHLGYQEVINLIHEADRPGVEQAVKAALAPDSTGTYQHEYRVVGPEGAEHWLEAKGQVYFRGDNSQRQPVRFIGTVRDITERRHIEQALSFLAACGTGTGENFFQSLARFLTEILKLDFAVIDRLERGTLTARTVAVFGDGGFQPDFSYALKDTPCAEAVAQGICCFASGVKARFPKDKMLQDLGAESYAGVVLRNHLGQAIGLIALVGRRRLTNPRWAESLLRLVAGRAVGELERQQAEQALRQNEERLMLAQHAGRVGVFDVDFQANARFWSAERKALFGVPATFEPTHGSWSSFLHAEDRAAAERDLQRAFSNLQREVTQRYRISRPDGQVRWLEDRMLVTYSEGSQEAGGGGGMQVEGMQVPNLPYRRLQTSVTGQPVRMVGTTTDITSEVEAKHRATLRVSQLRFSAVRMVIVLAVALFLTEAAIMLGLAHLPGIGPWVSILIDSVGLVILVSPVLYYFSFRPLVTILQQRDQVEEALRRTNETLESRVKDRTASLELANQKLELEVAERKQAEAALSESREDLKRAQTVAHVGSWRLNVQGNELIWSEETYQIFGVARGTALSYETFLRSVHPRDHNYVHGRWMAALRGEPYDIEHRIIVGDGVKWVRERAELEFNPDGTLLGGFGIVQDITERKLAEEALRESEERLRLVLDFSNDAVFWADADTGYILRCNRRAEELTERSREELVGMHQSQLHPADRNYQEIFRQAASTERAENIEAELLGKSGRKTPVLINYSVVTLGGLRIIQGVFRDITARKRGEDALRESETRFRALFEQAAVGVAQIEARTGRFVRVNQKFSDILGYSLEEMRSLTLQQILQPDENPDGQQMGRLLAGELREFSMEKRCYHKQGSTVWVHLTLSPMASAGEPAAFHIAVVQDIRDRKRFEAALGRVHAELEKAVQKRTAKLLEANEMLLTEIRIRREAEEKIKQAEFRYRTVANFTHDWEYWRSPEGALLYCSPSCERISGWTADELIKSPALVEQMVHPEDKEVWRSHEHEAKTSQDRLSAQFRILTKSGATRWIEHVCTAITNEAGDYLGVRASNRDITDRQQTELEAQQLRTELSRASRITMAGQLTAAIAHELNQPLGAILCNAQSAEKLLNRESPDLAEARDALSDILADSRRAGTVIQRLRSLYQNSGQNRSPLDLNNLVQETVNLVHSELVLKGITVHLELEPELPCILGNATELQQVILNLLLNALDAMSQLEIRNPKSEIRNVGEHVEPEHLERRVTITTCQEAETVRCSTADTGPGIDPAKLGRIFEPFFTTKSKGMGMGLAICRAIIEAHGGRLSAENAAAGGAILQFNLPKATATAEK